MMFEPSADARMIAATLWGVQQALMNCGFTHDEAFALLVIIAQQGTR